MANSITFKDQLIKVGDTITVNYTFKEGEKERSQLFKGILIKIKGSSEVTRMITVRKISKVGIGVERIIPLASPFVKDIKVNKSSDYQKAKLFFIRDLSESEIRHKLYRQAK